MYYSCMADGYISPDSHLMLCICMQDTAILDVRAISYDNSILIPADHSVWKNTAVLSDCHVPNDDCAWCNEARVVDFWHIIIFINGNKDPYLIVFSKVFFVQIKTYIITESMLPFLRVSK